MLLELKLMKGKRPINFFVYQRHPKAINDWPKMYQLCTVIPVSNVSRILKFLQRATGEEDRVEQFFISYGISYGIAQCF